MRVLVTGSGGTLAPPIIETLSNSGVEVIAASRNGTPNPPGSNATLATGDLATKKPAFNDQAIDVVVHLAGASSRRRGLDHHRDNCVATKNLAETSVDHGVRLIVFLSSTAVYGDRPSAAVGPTSPTNPSDAYGQSKLDAEFALSQATAGSETAVVVLRSAPALGETPTGGLALLNRAAEASLPVPRPRSRHRRSVVTATSLAQAVRAVVSRDWAGATVFTVADEWTPSACDLAARMSTDPDRSIRGFNLPAPAEWLLRRASRLATGADVLSPLLDDFVVEPCALAEATTWRPEPAPS